MSDIVQYIIIRKDLNMRKGKMVAQGAHASLSIFTKRINTNTGAAPVEINLTEDMEEWLQGSFTKICLYVNSEADLMSLYNRAKVGGFLTSLITDKGLTEFNNIPTRTCIAIGPVEKEKVKHLTENLKLL